MRLLRTEEKNFLQTYWLQYFENLRKNESRSMIKGVLDNHPGVSKFLRAHLVDWLMHVCKVLPKEDQTLPFVASSLMDRFFALTPKHA